MPHPVEGGRPASEEQKLLHTLIEEVRRALEKTELALARSREGNVNDVKAADAGKK